MGGNKEELFAISALAFAELSEFEIDRKQEVSHSLSLELADLESLLVDFLNEILFISETQNLGFDNIQVKLSGKKLEATMSGGQINSRTKEIKAVTFHNLKIEHIRNRFQAVIVFDV